MSIDMHDGELERTLQMLHDGLPLPDNADEILAAVGLDREGLPLDEPRVHGEEDGEEALEMLATEATDADLVPTPGGDLTSSEAAGVPDEQIVAEYTSGHSLAHILRCATQPATVRPLLEEMVSPLARQMCREAGVEGMSALLHAEQAVEARMDEVHYRALAGHELGKLQVSKAERLMRMADRCSRRMAKAIEQLHRLKRPKVNVRIARAGNVNLGQQQVVNQQDGGASSNEAAS